MVCRVKVLSLEEHMVSLERDNHPQRQLSKEVAGPERQASGREENLVSLRASFYRRCSSRSRDAWGELPGNGCGALPTPWSRTESGHETNPFASEEQVTASRQIPSCSILRIVPGLASLWLSSPGPSKALLEHASTVHAWLVNVHSCVRINSRSSTKS